jgi:hypothetical protein
MTEWLISIDGVNMTLVTSFDRRNHAPLRWGPRPVGRGGRRPPHPQDRGGMATTLGSSP